MTLRIVYMGTPDFAVGPLAALLEAGHEVCCIYSQPPRPSGRGHKVTPSPVHAFAEARGIEVRTPRRLRSEDDQQAFADLNADVAVVAAYGLILPKPVLDAPKHGCINIHASLLPRWRGAAPIQHAILAGDTESGVTIMQMDEGLDTGDMLLMDRVAITTETTATTLHDALAILGSDLIVQAMAQLEAGTLTATPQPEAGTTYASKLSREDGRLNWALNGFTLQHQLLQTIDLLLNSTLLLQIRIDLLAQGTDLRLGVGTHPWYAGKLAIHQLATHQVLGLDRCQQG